MVRIGFIEDDMMYLKSLRETIHLIPNMLCTLAVNSVEEFWEKLPRYAELNIIFIDIDLPGQSGIDALPKIKKQFPRAELIMLTNYEDRDTLLKSFTLGASGYLLKDFHINAFPSLIYTLLNGGALISARMARWVIEYFQPSGTSEVVLTDKELQLLKLFSVGNSYEESADILGISVNGVKYRVKKIYTKLNVDNKIDALRAVKGKLK